MIDVISRNKILTWAQTQTAPHPLCLMSSPHPEWEKFDSFARELSEITPLIEPIWKEGSSPWGFPGLPGFLIRENIRYSALALGRELSPFLESLSWVRENRPTPSPHIQALLDRIETPCSLTLYIARECPHCPAVVRTMVPLALFCKKIHLQIIDGTLFPEIAVQDTVMSVPCLILDRGFRWTGSVDAQELVSYILGQDPSQLTAHTLKDILEKGDAVWIAQQMIQADTIFDGFVQLLLDSTWSVRLGAMVIVETLGEKAPGLAARLAPLLIKAFAEKEIPVQGDILYALGETGTRQTKEWIKEMLGSLKNQDLKEAAEDAILSIDSRQ